MTCCRQLMQVYSAKALYNELLKMSGYPSNIYQRGVSNGGSTSIWHWIIVLAVVLILFARPGKISGIAGDLQVGSGTSVLKV